jgi:hypothetical protein
MISMSSGSLPASASACAPTAATFPVVVSIAIADGSSITSPRPATQMSVLAVPRSIAMFPRKRMVLILLSDTPYALLSMEGDLLTGCAHPEPVTGRSP